MVMVMMMVMKIMMVMKGNDDGGGGGGGVCGLTFPGSKRTALRSVYTKPRVVPTPRAR